MASALGVPVVDRRLEDGKEAAASRDVLDIVFEDSDLDEETDEASSETFVKVDPKKLGYSYIDFSGNLGLIS